MIVAGVDPGADTGLVVLDVPGRHLRDGRWVASTILCSTRAKGLTYAGRDANLFDRLAAFFGLWQPDLVVMEEPVDAMLTWRGHRQQQRGTSFRLGAYYALALTAAHMARPSAVLASYPVTTTTRPPRKGWMQGKPRVHVLGNTAALARELDAPPDVLEMRFNAAEGGHIHAQEHVLMALGVIAHHWATTDDPLQPPGVG